ncbi:hypothetical protein AGMMS49965_19930 [Bacteroidia bacterium]|nr:hypothetical protein AGMMS49965_19930 [Bacteroidia bacterium]
MYTVEFYKRKKVIGTENYRTLEDAEQKLEHSDYYMEADYYEILDEDGETVDSNEFVDADDMLEQMFPDEDSQEGFDWTLGD